MATLSTRHPRLMTSYYKKLLRPNETALYVGKLHWRVYIRAACLFAVALLLIGAGGASQSLPLTIIASLYCSSPPPSGSTLGGAG